MLHTSTSVIIILCGRDGRPREIKHARGIRCYIICVLPVGGPVLRYRLVVLICFGVQYSCVERYDKGRFFFSLIISILRHATRSYIGVNMTCIPSKRFFKRDRPVYKLYFQFTRELEVLHEKSLIKLHFYKKNN